MSELRKIVCVEDDADIRAIIELALADIGGFDVVLFPDGPTALNGIEAEAPQLVLLDMMMPGMNGMEVLAALRERSAFQETPVVFMTAKAQSHEIAAYREAGAMATILKPFDPISLPDQVQAIWKESTGAA